MQTLLQLIPAFKSLLELGMQATLAPANSLNGWSLSDRDPQVIQQLRPLLDWLYCDYFRVQTDGWEHLPPSGKALLIGSHNGGLAAPDLYMVMRDWYDKFGVDRPAYALMNPAIWTAMPGSARLAAQVGALRAHPKMALAALQQNATLLIYPGGAQDVFRPYSERHKIHLHGRRGFIKLALQTETPIVPVISAGAHSTLIVLADIYPQLQQLHQYGLPWLFGIDPEVCPIYLGLPWGIAIGPLPNIPFPVQIHTRVCRPIVFERYGEAAADDREYVDRCYDLVQTRMQSELDRLTQSLG
ncbi:lysophospholipid acyltransferase family protein [Pantanalinema sp. GBBB05]|uniref:lysophospholipid acyltransferase family protein n=1 Tax=Pantanalinema sp. GBBB05 TaxID=2604139 RepID=UPI001DCA3A26|nr:acyltransferase family protein [Pantanalinema sp. GBBB05]